MLLELEYLILIFYIYSFAGWFMESFGGIFKEKKLINRGFLIGPYCPVYGIGVVFITILLNKYKDDFFALFILSTVICGSLEYFTSYIMEKLFNARWWDYHNKKFNINGRICLETLIPFGIAGTLILRLFNPIIYSKLYSIPINILHIITIVLVISFIIDFIISFTIILSFKGAVYSKKDNTEEISTKVKEKTDELSEKVIDKAEYTFMKMESKAIHVGRNIKVNKIKIERKVRYTRKNIAKMANIKSIKELSNELTIKKDILKKSLVDKTKELDKQIKSKQKEVSEQIIDNFKNRSILSKRLMEAFPKISIKNFKVKNDKLQK